MCNCKSNINDEPRPQANPNPDFTSLIKMVDEGLSQAIEEQWEDEDFKHYIYEEVMIAIYGRSFFKWRNKQNWGN